MKTFKIRQVTNGLHRMLGRKFDCPICQYRGAFDTLQASTGNRKHALCPNCGSLERHRLQKLVLDSILTKQKLAKTSVLHIAPEPHLKKYFKPSCGYLSADLAMQDVDINLNLTERTPFDDARFDLVFASHVLEHIKNDEKALAEIRRIIRPGGFAILPVPVVCEKTIEYDEPNPHETGHVRAPGYDYFDRYEAFFDRVELKGSDDFSDQHQLYLYEDRSNYPTRESPMRTPTFGIKHRDIVPICVV